MAQQGALLLGEANRAALATIIDHGTKGDEDRPTTVPNLTFFRREEPSGPGLCEIEPSLVVAVQGAKRVLLGSDAYVYDSRHFLVASHDVPASSQVIEASPERPCLGFVLKLDLRMLAEVAVQAPWPHPKDRPVQAGMALGVVTPELLDSFRRLVDLTSEPEAMPVLAPLVQREICYRLLSGDQAARFRQLTSVGSRSHLVASAINWLKANYATPLRIEDLAQQVHLSPSSLHRHFRELTSMSPLQYQKWLRLHEARRLMLNEAHDATRAAFQVGYESPSQFSREYTRLFGAPPKRDVDNLRQQSAPDKRSLPAVS